MKIEMGESIILSWLKHAKSCQVVQLNWKPSVTLWDNYEDSRIENIVSEIREIYLNEFNLDIFKKNSSTAQIIQQGEVDALGIEVKKKEISSIYAVDVAFHENGLNYGSKKETAAKIIKKMVRTIITLINYFEAESSEIIFISPKIGNPTQTLLDSCIIRLNQYLNSKKMNFPCRIISNNEFKTRILDAVLELSNSVADTSELFMRSIQLVQMFYPATTITINNNNESQSISNETYEEIKIGSLVRNSFESLRNILNEKEIKKLQNEKYCKEKFGVSYPVLIKKENNISKEAQIKINNSYRYYTNPYKLNGKEYYLTNYWMEKCKQMFIKWYNEVHIISA